MKSSWGDQQSRLRLLRPWLGSAWKNPLTARIFLVSSLLLMQNVPRTGTLPSRQGHHLPENDLGFWLKDPPITVPSFLSTLKTQFHPSPETWVIYAKAVTTEGFHLQNQLLVYILCHCMLWPCGWSCGNLDLGWD